MISEISGVEAPDTFVRPSYAGNALATVQSSAEKKVLTVRGTAFEPAAAEGGSAQVERVSGGGDAGLSSFVSHELSNSARPALAGAPRIVSGSCRTGRGSDLKHRQRLEEGTHVTPRLDQRG